MSECLVLPTSTQSVIVCERVPQRAAGQLAGSERCFAEAMSRSLIIKLLLGQSMAGPIGLR